MVRFVQADNETCVIEGTIDGLRPGLHGLHIHECGDISRGCERYVCFHTLLLRCEMTKLQKLFRKQYDLTFRVCKKESLFLL